jgi:hypothetical protein
MSDAMRRFLGQDFTDTELNVQQVVGDSESVTQTDSPDSVKDDPAVTTPKDADGELVIADSESVTQTDSPDSVKDDPAVTTPKDADGEQALQPKRKMPEWTVVELTSRQPRRRTRMDIWCAARKKDFLLVVKNPGDRLADKTRAKRIAGLLEKLHKMRRDKYGRTCKTLPLFFQKVEKDYGVTLLPKHTCEHCLWPTMVCKCCTKDSERDSGTIPCVVAHKDAKSNEQSAWGAPSVSPAAALSVRPRTNGDRILTKLLSNM